jgi:hypothetical protein
VSRTLEVGGVEEVGAVVELCEAVGDGRVERHEEGQLGGVVA